MSIPEPFAARIAEFPAPLRQLIADELAAGNTIVEVASCFPAPPAGAYVKLAKLITTRPRESTEALDFYDRNSPQYSGEWTDAKRFYFVIEPPHPPPPEPDPDAIRAAMATEGKNGADASPEPNPSRTTPGRKQPASKSRGRSLGTVDISASSVVGRFRTSMIIDYEKWHDGIGYDLSLLKEANPTELQAIEELVLSRDAADWRDIEALAALKSDRAKAALHAAFKNGSTDIRLAVLDHAPEIVPEKPRTAAIITALRTATIYRGLSRTIDHIVEFHPPEIVDELLRSALTREGEVAVHFAALALYLHDVAKEPFDWEQRPFLLRFGTPVGQDRETVFRELCGRIGVDPAKYIRR